MDSDGLTIAQLSHRTGVAAPTLRMWEARHGFPAPTRLPGGHRRYADDDVQRVLAVIRGREEGLSLAAAIPRALAAMQTTAPVRSIFAGLAPQRHDARAMMLAKPEMLALTRAIEDDYCARAGGGVLVGSFQRVRFFRQSSRRWNELARTARLTVAMADFKALRQPTGRPTEVPIAGDSPLAREWAIVFHAPGASACLSAWEVPETTTPHDRDRRFEVLWSPEPQVAHAAIAAAAEAMAPLAPDVARRLIAALDPAATSPPELHPAIGQAQRMLAYLAAERAS